MTNVIPKTLRDLGERGIVQELIIPRFPATKDQIIGIGDDCAVLPAPPEGTYLVATTDPCPTPVACLIAEPDYYLYGWMTVMINVSDIGSMGATPLGILISTVMPEDMSVQDYERFLEGLADASREWRCPVIGGNIKDGPDFTATGTALGFVKKEHLMRRTGAKQGDQVCVIGEMGFFWSAVLSRTQHIEILDPQMIKKLELALSYPIARIKEGIAIAKSYGVTACMDSSDGVSGCLTELAIINKVDILIHRDWLSIHPIIDYISQKVQIDPVKLLLSWGDWELVCTVSPDRLSHVKSVVDELGTPFHVIGEVMQGDGIVMLEVEGKRGIINNFASERFSGTSFFTHGLQKYIDFLLKEPLLKLK